MTTPRVLLEVTNGKLAGRRFEFEEHDTFLFGRNADDCHAAIAHDQFVSRHHFLLEVNPPDAQLRDLGSLNGTVVNGTKWGGRDECESPEEGARRVHPVVRLNSGDTICVGDTEMRFVVQIPDRVTASGTAIPPLPTADDAPVPVRTPTVQVRVILCQQCHENVADEVGPGRTGDYVCNACRSQVASDPMQLLRGLMQAAADPTEIMPQIPGYDIGEKLGKGGMGVVYQATCRETGQVVAIKLMLSQVAVDKTSRERFLRECDILAGIRHPNIVTILKSGSAGSAFYCVTEYCNAGALSDRLRKSRTLPPRTACRVVLQVLKGLNHAHRNQLVHRDIKPQNILLHKTGKKAVAKVCDFGLAKSFEQSGFSGMTATGSFAGTYHFMPREQLTDFKRIRPVSDVWSTGATLYHALTGDFPREFDDERHPTEIIMNEGVVPVRQRDSSIPVALASVVDRSLLDDVEKRYQDAGEMSRALVQALKSIR